MYTITKGDIKMIEVEVALIAVDVTHQPIIFLREKEGAPKRLLPIWEYY